MPYQIYHKKFGFFQGDIRNWALFYPTSFIAIQGICPFRIKKDAKKCIERLIRKRYIIHIEDVEQEEIQLEQENFEIQKYDEEFNERIVIGGMMGLHNIERMYSDNNVEEERSELIH